MAGNETGEWLSMELCLHFEDVISSLASCCWDTEGEHEKSARIAEWAIQVSHRTAYEIERAQELDVCVWARCSFLSFQCGKRQKLKSEGWRLPEFRPKEEGVYKYIGHAWADFINSLGNFINSLG